ncbi:Alpha-1,3-mannosyltransferase-like protein [Orbilia blumenaviensis]|uniref:Alpha-1,3/1,6-mannosyltransferase ALG2 n=1 Tax=Orbilia blumenaviensis TaxID=1796055 RepID=A0AAV9VK36_9PEZI
MDEDKVIVFIHPDLGIGGAERLIVDAAVGLQNLGHTVQIWTSHCDPAHCFDECRDGTLKVVVRGNRFPTSILGRFSIFCAIIRQIDLITYFLMEDPDFASATDFFIVDQLSVCVPILRYFLHGSRTLFYCHFPDKFLTSRKSIIKSIYRIPFDWIEGYTTGLADGIVVNSKFTASMFRKAFPKIDVVPRVVYPCVDVNEVEKAQTKLEGEKYPFLKGSDRKIVLSVNRFERKKDIDLVVKAFSGLTEEQRKKARLIIAGGYDNRVAENVEYHIELERLCDSLNLRHATCRNYISSLTIPSDIDVLFLPSVPSSLKSFLLRTASILAYTPENEHFGIVPLEAMLVGTPVLATNTGGPLETVLDGGETGWLRPPEPAEWTRIITTALFELTDEERTALGERARSRVKDNFSKESMSATFQKELEIIYKTRRRMIKFHDVMMPVVVSTVVIAGLLAGVGRTDWAYVCGFVGGGTYLTFGLLSVLARDMNPRL